jgi:hypothetical protein
MIFTISFTGVMEDWGCGLLHPEYVQQCDKYFVLKEGYTLEDIENKTIEIIPCTEEEISKLNELDKIPQV